MDGGEREDVAVLVVAMLGCWWREGRLEENVWSVRPFSMSASCESGSSEDVMHCGCE